MQIVLELNRRHGYGFQLRVMHGPMDKLFDEQPWSMYEAGAAVAALLEVLNKELGTSYEPHQVIRVTQEAMEVNAKHGDFAALRMLQDIQTGRYELSTPGGQDFQKTMVDGEEEFLLSGRGIVLVSYFSWLDDKNQKAREVMRRYCRYISAHGYKGGSAKALAELDGLSKDDGMAWIRRTYARHVHDDAALIQFVMGQL